MQAIGLQQAFPEIEYCLAHLKEPGNREKVEALLWPALDQFPEIAPFWFYAGAYLAQTGRHALAIRCFERSYELQPNPEILSDMGACYRCLNRSDDSRRMLLRSLEHLPDDSRTLTNLCGSYVNEGDPWPGIEYGERALALEANDKAKWNLSLLHLEAANYARGFDLYSEGKHEHREQRDYALPGEAEPSLLTPELHGQLKGHGKTLIVHGEQGLGDELMFCTQLLDVIRDYDIVLDCHPRLEWLHRNASWARELERQGREVRIVPTRKNFGEPQDRPIGVKADAKIAAGDLCRLYRRQESDFAWRGPTYCAPEAEIQEFREHLMAFAGGRKIIGLAMRGGTISTNTRYRRLPLPEAEKLLAREDCLFVGLDYEDMTEFSQYVAQKFGPERYIWSAAINFAWDYHHVAALIAATDSVITVPQSVMHLSAGMGHSTEVLVPSKPDWRMGQTGSSWIWYPGSHCTLHRQIGNDWNAVVDSAMASIDARLSRKEAA